MQRSMAGVVVHITAGDAGCERRNRSLVTGARVSFPDLARNDETENVATVNKEKYILLFFFSPSSNGVPWSRACTLYVYLVNAALSIKVNVRSLHSFHAILSRKCEMNGSPGSRRHQLIPGPYRPSSRSYSAFYGGPRVRTLYAYKVSRYQYGKLDFGD